MSASEAWVPCPTCGGDGIEYAWPDDAAADTHPCPDCADGRVPSDGEIEAAVMTLIKERWGGMSAMPPQYLPIWREDVRITLVAARRYQRKAGKR